MSQSRTSTRTNTSQLLSTWETAGLVIELGLAPVYLWLADADQRAAAAAR